MTSTFFGIELGKRGLFAQQAALYTTGQNISNANTDGYTRQRAEMQATSPIPYPGMNADRTAGQLGTGVEVNKIARLRDDFLDVQYRNENTQLGYWQAKGDTLNQIEQAVNEPSNNGIANAMDQFWTSWQELAKDPENSSARSVVRENGAAVAESIQFVNNSLTKMQSDLDNVISTKVDSVNSLATQISALNTQISRIVPNNYQPNDLYDKRDQLIDQLSNLVDIKVTPTTNGMIQIAVGSSTGSNLLVDNQNANALAVDNTGNVTIGGNNVTLSTGELQGRIESRYTTIPSYINNLNTLTQTFASAVNAVHESGYNLDDINSNATSPSGLPFFTDGNGGTSSITAGNISVNQAILNSLNKIAASSSTQPAVGNADNAQAIAKIQFDATLNFTDSNGNKVATSTADDFYQNIIGQLGVSSQEAQRMQDNSQLMVNQVDSRRQSVSGVSLDEEMSNMIRYQQAYNACARVVTTMDQVLDKVINGMGAGA